MRPVTSHVMRSPPWVGVWRFPDLRTCALAGILHVVVLDQIPGTKNGHELVLKSMKLRFEPTKFEGITMPNTMATLPGPSLATKRPNIIEIRRSIKKHDGQSSTTLRFGAVWGIRHHNL